MEIYTTNTHTIAVSLNERTIYLKLTDKVNYMTYEANLDNKELRLTIELADAYKLMCNCFAGVAGHNIICSVNAGIMRVVLSALVGGYLNMKFDVILKEKIMSNDGQLTTTINRLEQKQQANMEDIMKNMQDIEKRISEMNAITEALSNAYIYMGGTTPTLYPSNFVSINSTNIWFRFDQDMVTERIKILYKLETIKFHYYREPDLKKWSNITVRDIIIECHSEATFKSLYGLDNCPKLESLTVINAPQLEPKAFIENNYKVKKLNFKGCPLITSSLELREYCTTNDIVLVVA